MLSIPVKLGSAVSENGDGLDLHQYSAIDGGRIRIKRVSEKSGKEVQWADIRSGYQAPDGTVVTLSDDDFEQAYGKVSREAQILMFASAGDIPDAAKAKPFIVQPAKGGERAYALLAAVLRKTGRVAVLRVGIRQRKRLAVISERDGYLILEQLTWAADLVKPDFEAPSYEFSAAEMRMATKLVDGLTEKYDHSAHEDDSAAKLGELITARLAGTAKPKAESSAPADLMSVLSASVQAAKAKRLAPAASDGQADAPKSKATRTRKVAATSEQQAKPRTVKAVPAAAPTRRRTPGKVTTKAAA
jgi:DNA end-binding protein Ku